MFTNSESSTMACPKQWEFSYLRGFTQSSTPAPLRQGTLAHHCVQTWWRNPKLSAEQIGEEVIDPWIESREDWIRSTMEPDEAEALLAEDVELGDLTLGMLGSYIAKYKDDEEDWETIAIEAQAARWITNPENGKPLTDYIIVNGKKRLRRWAYGGSIDRIARRKSTGGIWIWEQKNTSKQLHTFCRKLLMDPQTRGYDWAVRDPVPGICGPEIEGGIEPDGIIYDTLRKAVPRKPEPLAKCRNCGHPRSKHLDGGECEGSKKCDCRHWQTVGFSQAAIDTTREMYAEAIDEAGFDRDDYVDILEDLPGLGHFVHREPHIFDAGELEACERDIAWRAMAAVAGEKSGYRPRQVSVCHGFTATGCPGGFEPICLGGEAVGAAYRVKVLRHEELTGDMAEPWMGELRGVDKTAAPEHHKQDNDSQEEDSWDDDFPEF